jgi:hypothetical protein
LALRGPRSSTVDDSIASEADQSPRRSDPERAIGAVHRHWQDAVISVA